MHKAVVGSLRGGLWTSWRGPVILSGLQATGAAQEELESTAGDTEIDVPAVVGGWGGTLKNKNKLKSS